MNLPTKLTVLRLILSVFIIFILCFPFYMINVQFPVYYVSGVAMDLKYLISGVVFIAASVTDWFDGYLARKNNQVTDTGKMLDAIADKVLVNPVLIILAANHYIHVIVPVVIVLRDIVVNAIKMEAAGKGKVVAAIKSGKFKTATLMVGITLSFFYNMPFILLGEGIDVANFLLYVAVILSIISGFQYWNMNKNIIFTKED